MAEVNPRNIMIAISKIERLKVIAERKARADFFNPAVKQLLEDFDNDPITIEISEGKGAENISNTLPSSSHSNMNLYSFIGFNSTEENPIVQLRKFLNPNTKVGRDFGPQLRYQKGSRTNEGEYQFRITEPDREAIYKATPLPWAKGISWVYRIERGIPGVGKFLNKDFPTPDPSRSGGGLQVDAQLRGGSFKNRSYLTSIFAQFLRNAKTGK